MRVRESGRGRPRTRGDARLSLITRVVDLCRLATKTHLLSQNIAALVEESESESEVEDELLAGEDSSDEEKSEFLKEGKRFTLDVDIGIEHYRALREDEQKKSEKPGWFGGKVEAFLVLSLEAVQ